MDGGEHEHDELHQIEEGDEAEHEGEEEVRSDEEQPLSSPEMGPIEHFIELELPPLAALDSESILAASRGSP